MSGNASTAHVPRGQAARADSMAGSSGDAVRPGATTGTVQTGPSAAGPSACGDARPVLPRRVAFALHVVPARTIRPPADPALLRRVLDGLKQL
jgi:hypothetical protein